MFTIVTVLTVFVVFVNLVYGIMMFFKKSIRYRLFPKDSLDIITWLLVGVGSTMLSLGVHFRRSIGFESIEGIYVTFFLLCVIPIYYIVKVLSKVYENIEES